MEKNATEKLCPQSDYPKVKLLPEAKKSKNITQSQKGSDFSRDKARRQSQSTSWTHRTVTRDVGKKWNRRKRRRKRKIPWGKIPWRKIPWGKIPWGKFHEGKFHEGKFHEGKIPWRKMIFPDLKKGSAECKCQVVNEEKEEKKERKRKEMVMHGTRVCEKTPPPLRQFLFLLIVIFFLVVEIC